METIALNFGLDLQEKNNKGGDFVENLKLLLADNIGKIDMSKSEGQLIAFTDNSGCEFAGHDIKLIDRLG